MNPTEPDERVIDRLRNRDDHIWLEIHEKTLPRVLAGLFKCLNCDRRWLDLEGFVASAMRSFLRRLDSDEPTLKQIASVNHLGRYLFGVARNKGLEAIRHEKVENAHASRTHASRLATVNQAGDEWHKLADWFLSQLVDDDERLLFTLKLAGKNEDEIAVALGRASRTIRRDWHDLCERVRERCHHDQLE